MPTNDLSPLPPAFEGTFVSFFEKYLVPNLPSRQVVESLHAGLLSYVDDPETRELITRKFGPHIRMGFPYNADDGRVFYVGDNSPALWMYARSLEGGMNEPSLHAAIRHHNIPIGMVCSKNKRGETRQHWRTWGLENWATTKFYRPGFYLAHVVNAAEGLPIETSLKGIRRRMLRFLHPANYLAMPTHHVPNMNRPFHYICESGQARDLSEGPGIKDVAKGLLADLYGQVYSDFLREVNEPAGKVSHHIKIAFRRVEATFLPSRQEVNGSLVLVPSGDAHYLQIRDFGVAYCGKDGDLPFDIVVKFDDVEFIFLGMSLQALGQWDPGKAHMRSNTFMNNRNIKIIGSGIIEVTTEGFGEFELAIKEGRFIDRTGTGMVVKQRRTDRTIKAPASNLRSA